MQQHGQNLFCSGGDDPVFLPPVQNTDALKGNGDVCLQTVLSAPGGATGQNAVGPDPQEGLSSLTMTARSPKTCRQNLVWVDFPVPQAAVKR